MSSPATASGFRLTPTPFANSARQQAGDWPRRRPGLIAARSSKPNAARSSSWFRSLGITANVNVIRSVCGVSSEMRFLVVVLLLVVVFRTEGCSVASARRILVENSTSEFLKADGGGETRMNDLELGNRSAPNATYLNVTEFSDENKRIIPTGPNPLHN
ncbi:hypothetical protein AKJ16_DCAP17113 [Drosera capensis]